MKNILAAILYVVVIGGGNAIYWVWCKITGKKFEPFGGPE